MDDRAISLWYLEPNRADFLVLLQDKVKVNRILKEHKLNHSVIIMDVERRVHSTKIKATKWNEESLRTGHRLNWKEYPTLIIIEEYFAYLTDNYPSICNVTTIGYTAENRTIQMIKISNGNPQNKALLMTSGMHAREWAAITSALYVLDKVVRKFDHLPDYMKTIDWIFVPMLNPDGYVYSHTKDRLWRKNRRKLQSCRGVDLNRNFDIDWFVEGITNQDECYEGYSGPHAFSEPESRALRDVILDTKKKPLAMLDIHSYGELILYPWGARAAPTPDRELLWSSSKRMSEAIFNNTGKHYKHGAVYHVMSPVTGSAIDWMYFTGVALTFAMELGEVGGHGFLLPPENIEPTGQELLLAVKEFLKNIDPELIRMRGQDGSWFR